MRRYFVTMSLSTLLLLAACGKESEDNGQQNTTQADTQTNTNYVTPNADLLTRLVTAPVVLMDWYTKLKVAGSIELDEKRVARVGSTVSGRVTEIKLLRGDHVVKGDVLALIHSPALAEAQLTYLKSLSLYELAKKSAARAQLLYKEGVIAAAEQQRRESELFQSEAEWQAAFDRMHILGMTDEDIRSLQRNKKIQSVIALRAPIDGVVIDRKVSQGQVLEPADLAYTIADLSQVWIVGEVPERYSADMVRNKVVKVTIPALDSEIRKTQLIYVADTVTPQTRTLRVRAVLDNQDGRLKPDMLATLQIDGSVQHKLVIPMSAVIREENQDKVFVKRADNQFELVNVQLGEEEDDLRPVEAGLNEGDIVVTEGSFYLNADRLMKQQGT